MISRLKLRFLVVAAALLGTATTSNAEEPPKTSLLPIFFMHGILSDAAVFDPMSKWIRRLDPDVVLDSIPLYPNTVSILVNMWRQSQDIIKYIRAKVAANPAVYENGYTLVCHSQGALLCRTVVQQMDDHKVHTLISLAGPQQGEFGVPPGFSWIPLPKEKVYLLAYNSPVQHLSSIANYWHDSRAHDLIFHPDKGYHTHNDFLPVFNNDPQRTTQGFGKSKDDAEGERYKRNFLRLQRAVFTCSSGDEEIIPYDSACWSFYGESMKEGTVPVREQPLWAEDWIGLRALDDSNRLVISNVTGVPHNWWVLKEDVFERHIQQWLPSAPQRAPKESAELAAVLV